MDIKQCVWNHGQSHRIIGEVLEYLTPTRVVAHGAKRKEFPIIVQSKWRRLCLDVPDWSSLGYNIIKFFKRFKKHECGQWKNTVCSLTKGFWTPISDLWFPEGGLLVLNDLMEKGRNDKCVLNLFTKHPHRQHITVLYFCQDLFPRGKYAKSISRNAHYIVAFKNPRDQFIGDAKSIAASISHKTAWCIMHISRSALTSIWLHNCTWSWICIPAAMTIFESSIIKRNKRLQVAHTHAQEVISCIK